MLNAVGKAQNILLLGGTSDIGLAIVQEFLSHGPARVTLAARLDALLADPDACTAAGESAGAYIQQHSGATEQILRAIDL